MIFHEPRALTYFKRFRMEIDLQVMLPPVPALPAGYEWISWDRRFLEQHAEVKFECFIGEIDASVFPSLSSREGCLRLMQEIAARPGFQPDATWLISHCGHCCCTIQGVRDRTGMGAIQNVGVTLPHRGRGLGQAIVLQALHGFQRKGVHRVHLEATARNEAAIRLYRRLGFRCRKTLYKPLDPLAALQGISTSTWFA